jgi:inosine-uridine nucleoside N-ribohydrolase
MLRWLGALGALLTATLLVTLALPVPLWRTGDQGLALLDAAPEAATPPFTRRLWIDTDAACGHGRRTDPDDCLAIALLARSPQVQLAGISTVAGNAPLEVVERTTRALAAQLGLRVPVHAGTAGLRAALEEGPLTIVALGPLTNVARVLEEQPSLAARVSRLIAVMGRRPGHLFHPSEGAGGGMLFGHGPVFRDFNFALDPQASERVLSRRVPVSFVPYDAARAMELTAADLDRLERVLPWIVPRTRAWLDYWQKDIGRQGFSPFDLLAAAYALEPAWFRCVAVRAWVGEDPALALPWRTRALLVEAAADASALYCGRPHPGVKAALLSRFN